MKKFMTLCFTLLFFLCACSSETTKPEATNPPTSEETGAPTLTTEALEIPETRVPDSPEPTTEASIPETSTPPATDPAPTPPPATAPADTEAGYIIHIPLADQSIFSGPTYDSYFAGIVGVATNYTIVDETTDSEGNLWGKLKSGRGWVDLTEIRSGAREKLPITVNFADQAVIDYPNSLHFTQSHHEGAIQVAFRPQEHLRNFTFSDYYLNGEDFEIGETYYTAMELSKNTPVVVDLMFTGDFTMFLITFLDEEGNPHNYRIYESQRNNTICMDEITAS